MYLLMQVDFVILKWGVRSASDAPGTFKYPGG